MARIVQKFGGTSVADIERIRNAAGRVKREVDSGNQVVAVVSAMAGATNQLVEWTRQVNPLHDARDIDRILNKTIQLACHQLGDQQRPAPARQRVRVHVFDAIIAGADAPEQVS